MGARVVAGPHALDPVPADPADPGELDPVRESAPSVAARGSGAGGRGRRAGRIDDDRRFLERFASTRTLDLAH
jgi:hypothetical protein